MKLLPILGIFPWECVMCRCRAFCRDDGHRISHNPALHTQM